MEDDYSSTYHTHLNGTNGKSSAKRALYRNQDDTIDTTTYHDYPSQKPFINDDYQPPRNKLNSFPENKRPAVISALKNLQEKIRKLELERGAAESNLKSLAAETNKYKHILQRKEQENLEPTQTVVSKHTQELESQLTAAETRSQLLEKQLHYMRRLVENAEADRHEAVVKSTQLIEQKEETLPVHRPMQVFDPQAEKISYLEREQLKLTATQTIAEDKIRDLEEKLKEERQHRQQLQDKAVELQTIADSNRIQDSGTDHPASRTKKVKKKKKTVANKKQKLLQQQEQVQRLHTDRNRLKHYRLNLADIPFVAGKSSTPSHSVGANVQRVLSLMKSHSMALCSSSDVYDNQRSASPSSGSSSSSLDNDLADLIMQLQEEFGQLSEEHQHLSVQLSEETNSGTREDLERELDSLVSRMEAKSQQITKVRRHQQKLEDKKKKKLSGKKHSRPKTANGVCHKADGEVEVTTTIKTKGHNAGYIQIRPTSAREVSLNVLKDMRKLQTTLRKDDLNWE